MTAPEGAASNAARLRPIGEVDLDHLFGSSEIDRLWRQAQPALDALAIPDGTGGVNPGDRRAIFHLVCAFGPAAVLEVGTHIGASTTSIASALAAVAPPARPARLVSVDAADVNDPVASRWAAHGVARSPRQLVESLGHAHLVRFVAARSLDYLAECRDSFDFIFLDGDHSADTVYREVPAALEHLAPGGVILLHDYFPGRRPLWSHGGVISGPADAVERLAAEGVPVAALPLGALPWPTKLGSHVTSLALLLGPA